MVLFGFRGLKIILCLIVALLLVSVFDTLPIIGQDKEIDKEELERQRKEYKNKMLAQLESPYADERAEAGLELQGLINETDIKNLFKERPYALVELLMCGWPKAADCILNALYEYRGEEQLTILYADILVRNEKLSRIHQDLVVSKYVRQYWYENWRNRRPEGLVWAPVYQYVAANKWIIDLWYNDTNLFVLDKVIVSILSGVEFIPTNKWDNIRAKTIYEYDWIKALKACKEADRNLLLDINPRAESYSAFDGDDYYSSPVGWLSYAEIICLLLNKPEWAFQIQDKLANVEFRFLTFDYDKGGWVINWQKKDVRNTIFNALLVGINGDIDKCIEALTPYLRNEMEEWKDRNFDHRFLYHHPWFERLRLSPKFCEFWKNWDLRADFDNPDPIGLKKDWSQQ